MRPKVLKLLEENLEKIFPDVAIAKNFLQRTQIAQEASPRIDKSSYMKLKVFCTGEETVTRGRSSPQYGKTVFPNNTLDNGLLSRIHKKKTAKIKC